MSTKNIDYTNRESYLEKSEEMLLSFSNAYFYKKRFLLGEGVDTDKLLFYMQMNESLCTDSCEMLDFIKKKIEGRLSKCGVKTENLNSFSSYLKATEDYLTPKYCNPSDIISECCGWSEIEW